MKTTYSSIEVAHRRIVDMYPYLMHSREDLSSDADLLAMLGLLATYEFANLMPYSEYFQPADANWEPLVLHASGGTRFSAWGSYRDYVLVNHSLKKYHSKVRSVSDEMTTELVSAGILAINAYDVAEPTRRNIPLETLLAQPITILIEDAPRSSASELLKEMKSHYGAAHTVRDVLRSQIPGSRDLLLAYGIWSVDDPEIAIDPIRVPIWLTKTETAAKHQKHEPR